MSLSLAGALAVCLIGYIAGAKAATDRTSNLSGAARERVPGIVIDHSPKSSGLFIGSPSLAILTNGSYVASHDWFGPKSTENTEAVTEVFRSQDRGDTWRRVATLHGQFWSSLFVHRDVLFIIGTTCGYGNAVIRRSVDGGVTWTSPTNSSSGLLLSDGQYHCAPVPVVEHAGRIWRAFERRDPARGWGITFCAGMLSAATDADVLDAKNWRTSNFLPGNRQWLRDNFGGWLEGNAVVAPGGNLIDMLRVDTPGLPEMAAVVHLDSGGRTASFDPATDFVRLPGGAKKFTIRPDADGSGYWTLASVVTDEQCKDAALATLPPARIRNNLALLHSRDLRDWEVRRVLLHHPDVYQHAFQYVDWLFDGQDIAAVSRTAYDDGLGGAKNYHDANFLSFHRFANFRTARN